MSAQVLVSGRGKNPVEFGDGILTGRNTFQKFFEQSELKAYLESQLSTEAVPAWIGTFYLFRDEMLQQQFIANRFRRRTLVQRRLVSEQRLEEARLTLEPLMEVIGGLGRLPDPSEFPDARAVIERFGSLKRAFRVIKRITGEESWEVIAQQRREDILVYLALARFRSVPPPALSPTLQRDIKTFFGAYSKACAAADQLLFKAGDAGTRSTRPANGPLWASSYPTISMSAGTRLRRWPHCCGSTKAAAEPTSARSKGRT